MEPRAVLGWNRAYCALMILFYLVLAVTIFVTQEQVVQQTVDFYKVIHAGEVRYTLWSVGIYAIAMVGLNGFLMFAPLNPTMYQLHMLNHVAGIIKCICMPVAIPLLIAWLKPQTRALFGPPRLG